MSTKNRQRGATLIVGLIMLIALTLLVVSAIRSGTTNLRIAGNTQIQEEAKAAAQQAIEQYISTNLLNATLIRRTPTETALQQSPLSYVSLLSSTVLSERWDLSCISNA